jgi:predicted RNase H-like HicB family nuclease
MNTSLEKAEKLAELPFTVEVELDETTDSQPVYLARIQELDGCMSQGETIEQAVENLQQAKIDFIQSLLEDGLPVPKPSILATTTSSLGSVTFTLSNQRPSVERFVQERPSRLYEAALLTSLNSSAA